MVELASLMCSSALHNDCFVTGEAAVIASLTLQSDQRKTVAQTPCYHGVGRGWAAVAEFSLDCVMFIDIPSKPDWSKALPSKYLATFRARRDINDGESQVFAEGDIKTEFVRREWISDHLGSFSLSSRSFHDHLMRNPNSWVEYVHLEDLCLPYHIKSLKVVQNDAAPDDATEEEKFKYYGRLGGSDGTIVYAFAQTFSQFFRTFAGLTVHMPVSQGAVSQIRRGELCK